MNKILWIVLLVIGLSGLVNAECFWNNHQYVITPQPIIYNQQYIQQSYAVQPVVVQQWVPIRVENIRIEYRPINVYYWTPLLYNNMSPIYMTNNCIRYHY